MMKHHLERLRKSFWNYKQPLTLKPESVGVPVSDLFVWRKSDEWETFFELMDIPGLFTDSEKRPDPYVTILFFDNNGMLLFEKNLDFVPNQRRTLDLSVFIPKTKSYFGTFCVFHSLTPNAVSDLGSYIAERGYVSYRYKRSPLRAYVHGNLDAIAMLPNKGLQPLCTSSFLTREYRLQHELRGPAFYEIGVVNPSSRDQRLACHVLSACSGKIIETQDVQLKPKGCHVFPIQIDQSQSGRVVIKSHLTMARPLVYRIQEQRMDVFHG